MLQHAAVLGVYLFRSAASLLICTSPINRCDPFSECAPGVPYNKIGTAIQAVADANK